MNASPRPPRPAIGPEGAEPARRAALDRSFVWLRGRVGALRTEARTRLLLSTCLLAGSVASCSLAFSDDELNQPPGGAAGAPSGGGAAGAAAGTGGAAGAPANGAGAAGALTAGGAGGAGGPAGGGGASGAGGAGGAAAPVSLDACVLLLHMDEPAWVGIEPVKDASGKGNDGSPVNAATTSAAGKFGRAGEFDGSNWVEVPSSASLSGPLEALTYAAWVFPSEPSAPEGAGLIAKREGHLLNAAFTMFLYEDTKVFVDINDTRFNSPRSLSPGQWYHLAVVYDGKQADPTKRASLYINGALDTTAEVEPSIPANTQSILIGNLIGGGTTFRGRVDDVAIWARALGAEEVKAAFEANRPL